MANKRVLEGILLIVTLVVAVVLLFVLNSFTSPIILANNQGAELEPLFGVMPEAKGFMKLDSSAAAETVVSAWEETSGMGYAVRLSTTQGFTKEPIDITLAVGKDGKISNVVLETYPETRDFGAEYPSTYIGQDSTLAGAQIVAGVTYSSSAFRGAVADAFAFLVDGGYIGAGVKEPSQIIDEMIPVVATGMATPRGMNQGTELKVTSASLVQGWKAPNGSSLAFWMNNGSDYLVVINVSGAAVVYDLDGKDVTEAQSALVAEAKGLVGKNLSSFGTKDQKKIMKLVPSDATISEIKPFSVFSTVTTAFDVASSEGNLTAFVCRPYGFGNATMVIMVVIDQNGAIYALNADEFIIEAEYFSTYTLDAPSYKEGFKGVTAGSWNPDLALVSGATLTTEAVRQAVEDSFAAYKLIKGGN